KNRHFHLVKPKHPTAKASSQAPQKRLNTIVMLDLVGSTQLKVTRGDAAFVELITSLNRFYKRSISAHGGAVVSYMGDGLLAEFSSPTKALEFSMSLKRELPKLGGQRALSKPLDVRIGIATGETFRIGDNIAGVVVALAARLCSAAGDDAILVD